MSTLVADRVLKKCKQTAAAAVAKINTLKIPNMVRLVAERSET